MTFQPKIVGFLCNWCSYAAADLAGVSRFQYASNVRPVRVACSGRVDPLLILEMFEHGADGVFVGGCHLGDCHYISGNYQAREKIGATKKLLECAGVEPERLRLEWISASEGKRFANLMTDFARQMEGLGPSPLKGERRDACLEAMQATRIALQDFRLMALVGKKIELTTKGNVYGEKISEKEIDDLIGRAIREEFNRSRITLTVKSTPLSVKQISKKTGVSTGNVLKHIVALRDKGVIVLDRIDGRTPYYRTQEMGVR